MSLFGLICILLADMFTHVKRKLLISIVIVIFVLSSFVKLYNEDKMYDGLPITNMFAHIEETTDVESLWVVSVRRSVATVSFYLPRATILEELPASQNYAEEGWVIAFFDVLRDYGYCKSHIFENSVYEYEILEQIFKYSDINNWNMYALRVRRR